MNKVSIKQKIRLGVIGIFLAIFLVEFGLRLCGFVFLSLQERRNKISTRQKGSYRIMCLGESTTALGENNSYPRQLEDILNQLDIGIKFSVINKGVPAINTENIVNQFENNLNEYSPDMVITMMGVNDVKHLMMSEIIPEKNFSSFFRSLRIYKLGKLILGHISSKIREAEAERKNAFIIENIVKRDIGLMSKIATEYFELGHFYNEQGEYEKAEEMFKKTIDSSPEKSASYFELGNFYNKQGEYEKAEKMFIKALEIYPKRADWYCELGYFYNERRDYEKAEEMFKKTISANPEGSASYFELGNFYNEQGDYEKAEEMLKKAIEVDPKKGDWSAELGHFYNDLLEFEKAEEMFKKTVELNPDEAVWYYKLGNFYNDLHLYYEAGNPSKGRQEQEKAEEMFKKAMELDPTINSEYFMLGQVLFEHQKYTRVKEIYERVIEFCPKFFHEKLYGLLAATNENLGNHKLAEKYFQEANNYRRNNYNLKTKSNYLKIKEITDKNNIKLVCMQYPGRSIDSLKKILDSEEGLIFVDNEKVFKDVLRNGKYSDYFNDNFAGDFGHCTSKGNKLLAENVVKVLLREVFNK